jgi:hypothetical protein
MFEALTRAGIGSAVDDPSISSRRHDEKEVSEMAKATKRKTSKRKGAKRKTAKRKTAKRKTAKRKK